MKTKIHSSYVRLKLLSFSVLFVFLFTLLAPTFSALAAPTDDESSSSSTAENSAEAENNVSDAADNSSQAEMEVIEARTIEISSVQDLKTFILSCQDQKYSRNLTVQLTCDLDLQEEPLMPVPSFSGTFQGNGHTISGFVCAANGSHLGLFRYIQEDALVTNLTLKGSVIPQSGQEYLGGIAGTNYGTILSCQFEGVVESPMAVGGITGENYGLILNCQSSGTVLAKHFSEASPNQ